jgi:PAS domain S-box-containing protein
MTTQNKTLRVVFILAICCVFGVSVFSYKRITALAESAALLNHTTRVTLELEKVLGALKDAETGHRGYLMTHDARFLAPFKQGLTEYAENIRAIKNLIVDNPEQQRKLAAVELLAQRREAYMRKMVELSTSRTPTVAELLVGQSIMDSLRTEVNAMTAYENNLMIHRTAQLDKHTAIAPALLLTLSLMALAVLIIAYALLNKALLQAQKLKTEAVKQAVELEKTKEIKESEERFRSLAQTLPQLVWVTDAQGTAEFASSRWEDYSGIETGGEASWRAIVHPDDYDNINAAWVHSLTTGEVYNADVRLKSKTGEYRWHTVKGEPILDKDNTIIKWVGAFSDTHSEKLFTQALELQVQQRTKELAQSNLELENLNKELKEQKDFLETILNTSPDLIGAYNANMHIIAFNKACEDLFQVKKETIIGKKYIEAFPEAQDSQAHHDLKRALSGQTIHNGAYQSASTGRHYKNFVTPLKDASGEIYAVVAIAHDMTDVVLSTGKIEQANQALKEKNSQLQKSNKELEAFTYISSHDLQEPLRKIQSFASRILDTEQQNLTERGKDYFERMNNAAKRMQVLIMDLLAYSRTSIEDRPFENANLNEIISEIVEELTEKMALQRATIDVEELGEALVIPFQFRQMMQNLMGNALKFAKPDTPPHIVIKSERIKSSDVEDSDLAKDSDYLHITIADNGIGFEPQYKDRIFEVFQRLHDRQKIAGTGIGLAIVKKIVENHNGVISASSTLNEGAAFDIYIPTRQKETIY